MAAMSACPPIASDLAPQPLAHALEPALQERLPSTSLAKSLPLARQRLRLLDLTSGNDDGLHTSGNNGVKTALAGWGARIRTWEWRNQIPQFGLFQQWSF